MDETEYNSLEESPFKQLKIGEHSFIFKCFIKKCTCELLFSDLNTMWYEKLDAFAVMRKNSVLNPSIETSVERLLHHVIGVLKNKQHRSTEAASTLSVDIKTDDQLKITSESQLFDLSFTWEFNLAKRDNNLLLNQLIKPLISMVAEMSRRQQKLLKIMKHKDNQIADYKAEGFKIPRRHSHVEVFDVNRFEKEMTESKEFKSLALMSDGLVLNPELNSLYTSILRSQIHQRLAPAITNDDRVQSARESSMDGKKDGLINKELELERRQAIHDRLVEEKTKKEIQRRSKKLKL